MSLTFWCKILWVEFDILPHISIMFCIDVIFILCKIVAQKPSNCCQQDLPMNTFKNKKYTLK